jgi:hypothetical protein
LITAVASGSLRLGVSEPLKVPFIFLFLLLCTTLVCAALDTLSAWGLSGSAGGRFTLLYAAQHFPRSIYDVLVPSVVLSIVLLGLRLARRRISRFVALFIVLGVGYVVLVNGMLWIRLLTGAAPVAESPRQYLAPSTFARVGDRFVAVRSLTDGKARAVLVYDAAGTPRFTVAPAAEATVRNGMLTLATEGPRPLTISGAPDLTWTSVVAADPFTDLFLRDIRTMSADFQRLLSSSRGEFFAASFALVFLCTTSLMLLRLTRWPLVNVMLLGIAVRGWFSLYHFLAVSIAPQVARAVADTFTTRMVPSIAFTALGVLFLLVDILFLPGERPAGEPVA